MTAQDILRLIEAVDPGDAGGLYEIDMLVLDFLLNGRPKMEAVPNGIKIIEPLRYTRSRDALKAIRPDDPKNFFFTITKDYDFGYECEIEWLNKVILIGEGATEELAELHAIIQAVEYERSHK